MADTKSPASINPADLVGLMDIAKMFGVTAPAVSNWRKRHADFPAPIFTVNDGHTPVFLRQAVVDWYLSQIPEEALKTIRDSQK